MTPEGKVKAKVSKILTDAGAYFFYPATGGYGRSGVPDIVACLSGHFIGIECKAGSNKTTALQDAELQKIRMARGVAFIVNEDNVDKLPQVLAGITSLLNTIMAECLSGARQGVLLTVDDANNASMHGLNLDEDAAKDLMRVLLETDTMDPRTLN